ncbi:group II intron reverse transcriptase/maturase [Nocardioides sp. NPDC051685]|uniref:group II intron reverse transcriptase/maturase n=1 Tax=Nocardioides sp. NPDC051685 TaxID=3364334 RepID=UPI0037A690B0
MSKEDAGMLEDSLPNGGDLAGGGVQAPRARVREIQTKLHRWAVADGDRRFDDLYNLVCDPAFLLVAWDRVRSNKGSRTAGVDGDTARYIESERAVDEFLSDLRADLKSRAFRPLPVRERRIPKPGTTKTRRLGIPTVRDRVVQGALKLVLEPIFEADFDPGSHGFRPGHRAHDAIAEARYFGSHSYEWVVEGDITACFDEIDHTALMDRIRRRVGDKRVLALVKAFLKAGVLDSEAHLQETKTGTPQGGILSPLLANIALSVLDEYIASKWPPSGYERMKRRRQGGATYRCIRYADDFLIMVSGTRQHADSIREEIAGVLATMGLRLSPEKTLITHIDQGLDFLGWHIQRHAKKGGNGKAYVYNYPSKKALRAVMGKVKAVCRMGTNHSLNTLLQRLGLLLRGWATYFQPGVSFATFQYLRAYVWRSVIGWIRRKHRQMTWKELRRRYCDGG